MSLVSFQRDDHQFRSVEYLQWAVEGESGRVAELDDIDRIKPIVCVGSKRVPLKLTEMDVRILWRDTGAKHIKANWKKNQQQSQMPGHLVRLRQMWRLVEQSNLNNHHQDNDGDEPCFICNATHTNHFPVETAKQCCLCLLSTHVACAKRFSHLILSPGSASSSADGASHLLLPTLQESESELDLQRDLPTTFTTSPRQATGVGPGNVGQAQIL